MWRPGSPELLIEDAEVQLAIRSSFHGDVLVDIQRGVQIHDHGPIRSYVDDDGDGDGMLPQLEEDDPMPSRNNALEQPTGSIATPSSCPMVVDPDIFHGDLIGFTSTSGSESSESSDADSDNSEDHCSPVIDHETLKTSMKPWVAQAGLSLNAQASMSNNFHRRQAPTNFGELLRRFEPVPRSPARIHQGDFSRSYPRVHPPSSNVQSASFPIMVDRKTRSTSKTRSSLRATAPVFYPSLPVGYGIQGGPLYDVQSNHFILGRPRQRTESHQTSRSSPILRTDQPDVKDSQWGSHLPTSSSAKRRARDQYHDKTLHHRTTPFREIVIDSDSLASSGSSSTDDEGVAPNNPDQTTFLHGMDPAGPNRGAGPQKRRRIAAASTQPGTSQINNLTGLVVGQSFLTPLISLTGFSQGSNSSSAYISSQPNQPIRSEGPVAIASFCHHPTFSPFTPGADVVFLSQLIPGKYDRATREQIMRIFKCRAPYVPLCIMKLPAPLAAIWEFGAGLLNAQKRRRGKSEHPFAPNGRGWPTSHASCGDHPRALPTEIFEMIGEYLPRDSVQNMRYVNREFEKKVSCFGFRSVVVSFKPIVYGSTDAILEVKGKGKEKESIVDDESDQPERNDFRKTHDPKTTHIKDGMRVFEQWGPKVRKFALTFEVSEDSLKGLLPKKKITSQRCWWGEFEWPNTEYSRYEHAAKLEDKAEETRTMTTAFSKLRGIQELGLSMFSGLGWLTGPDVSDRVKLFSPKPVVFGLQYALPAQELREADAAWEKIIADETRATTCMKNRGYHSFFQATKDYLPGNGMPRVLLKPFSPRAGQIPPPLMYRNVNVEARLASELHVDLDDDIPDVAHRAIAAYTGTSADELTDELTHGTEQIIPSSLTPEQIEWLLEMQWAQWAFLGSWCIAVLDNCDAFGSLKTVTIANISSGLLSYFQRDDVWCALPSLVELTVLVSPDWRQVHQDGYGDVTAVNIRPSGAQVLFYRFLSALFAKNSTIKTLKIGYVGGGEQASGMFARNRNIVPAPIILCAEDRTGIDIEGILYFPHVKHLTMTNCWITPQATKTFFAEQQDSKLETVTFDSVSLTTDGRPFVNHHQFGGITAGDPASIATRRTRWLDDEPTSGSWCDVINTVTPGSGIDRVRYFYGKRDIDMASLPYPTDLKSITFKSCGYVRLTNMLPHDLDQSAIPDVIQGGLPECLKKRNQKLQKVMMQCPEDVLLGTIVPALTDEEEGCLRTVWGMEMGWGEDREKEKWNVREDCMGEGGLGRFRGRVKRVEDEEGNGTLLGHLKDSGMLDGPSTRTRRQKRRATTGA